MFSSFYGIWVVLLGFWGSSYHKMISCAANQFQYWNLLKELTEVAPESTISVSKHVDSRKRSQDPSKHLKFRVWQPNSCARVSFLMKMQVHLARLSKSYLSSWYWPESSSVLKFVDLVKKRNLWSGYCGIFFVLFVIGTLKELHKSTVLMYHKSDSTTVGIASSS